jgi:hypothetical protein
VSAVLQGPSRASRATLRFRAVCAVCAVRVAVATLVLLAAGSTARLSLPDRAFACRCAPSELAEYAGKPDSVILTGEVSGVHDTAMGGTAGDFAVDRVYLGAVPKFGMTVIGGGGGGDCTIHLEDGMQFIGVVTVSGNAVTPGLCFPHGDLRDARGQELLAEARVLFAVPPDQDEPVSFRTMAEVLFLAAAAVGLGTLVLAGTILAIRRRAGKRS